MARRRRGGRRDESAIDTLVGLAQASPRAGAVVAGGLVVAAVVLRLVGFGMAVLNDLLVGLALVAAAIVGLVAGVEAIRRRATGVGVGGRSRPAVIGADVGEATPYRRATRLVTPTEAAFYRELVAAAGPDVTVLIKVRLMDLLHLPGRTPGRLRWMSRVAQKHVDFVLCHRRTLQPFLLVELDDASHDRPDRAGRDAFVDRVAADAGWPLVHVPVGAGYDRAGLATVVRRHADARG